MTLHFCTVVDVIKKFKSRVTTELLNKAFRYHVIPT